VLAQIKKQRAAVQKPEQVVAALPEVLPLPKALELEPNGQPGTAQSTRADGALPAPPAAANAGKKKADSGVLLPTEDLKPLYDFALDCKACKAQLAAAQADLKDEQVKTQTVSKERDDALRVVKGGSVIQRVARAAKWFVIGAAVGAAAAKFAH
jgi:hypothetical protein